MDDRARISSWPQRLHRARGLGGAHQLQELGAVAERIVAARGCSDVQDVVVGERADVAAAAQQLAEGGNAGGEARLERRLLEASVLG